MKPIVSVDLFIYVYDDPRAKIDLCRPFLLALGIKVNEVNELVMLGMVAIGVILFIIVLCSVCHRKRKRRTSNGSLNAQFEISRPKPPFDLPPPGIPSYLSADSV